MLLLFLLLSLVPCSQAGANYYIYATTWDRTHAGTDSDIYIKIHGMKGSTSWYEMDLSGTDDFTRGDTDYYSFWRSEDVGDILCVELHTGGSDALLVYRVRIKSSTSGWKNIYNKRGQWLSRDSDEGIRQDKWCLNDCALDLPMTQSSWQLARTDFELTGVKVEELSPTVLDSHVMDGTNSSQDIETEYFASGTAVDSMTFSKTGGVMVSSAMTFTSHPVKAANSSAVVDDSSSFQFQHSVPFRRSEAQSSWYGCRAPAGKKVRCSAVMERRQVRVPYTQTWESKSRAGCTWVVAGDFTRVWDSDLEQKIEEI